MSALLINLLHENFLIIRIVFFDSVGLFIIVFNLLLDLPQLLFLIRDLLSLQVTSKEHNLFVDPILIIIKFVALSKMKANLVEEIFFKSCIPIESKMMKFF